MKIYKKILNVKTIEEQIGLFYVLREDSKGIKKATPLKDIAQDNILIKDGYVIGARINGKNFYIDKNTLEEEISLIIEE